MKGDFSKLQFRPEDNFTGVWHQQGRVLLDQDWNADTQIKRHLREMLGQDTIGKDVVAIPASEPDSLQVLEADSDGNRVLVTMNGGRGWVDGLHLLVPGSGTRDLIAEYYGPPIDNTSPDAGTIAANVRDAVILEVWEEAFNAFQDPNYLIEPALGGPDTTERSKLQFALRLLRLNPGDDCGNLAERLADDFSAKGRLTVTPAPTTVIGGDCPVQAGGGYSGFEHYLVRVEVDEPEDATHRARIKWSRFNGGLVGRGTFNNTPGAEEVVIEANQQMINHCGLSNFYFEVLAPDPDRGHWRVMFTAEASKAGDNSLALSNISGTWPGTPGDPTAFFRLWDGQRFVDEFPVGETDPTELVPGLGIRLELDGPASDNSNYRPGDYWTFPVRTAGVDFDPSVWPSNAPPQGVIYHRGPLGILNWSTGPSDHLKGAPEIHDCRRVFQPLTKIQTCCTYKVGDGFSSFGDFSSIQEAINHLPDGGGEICVLPGTYRENVVVDKDNVRIHGCGDRSHVVSDANGVPVFEIPGSHHVAIESLRIEADETGIGILATKVIEGRRFPEFDFRDFVNERRRLGNVDDVLEVQPHHLCFKDLTLHAATDSAIKVLDAHHVRIMDCRVLMRDVASEWSGMFLQADDMQIEHNFISVEPSIPQGGRVNAAAATSIGRPVVSAGRGGLHLAGTSERVEIIDNKIEGGIGNGITLGSVEEVDDSGNRINRIRGLVIGIFDPCNPCGPGDVYIPPGRNIPEEPTYQSAGSLYSIRIERNQIQSMGLNGIGVVGFFNLDAQDEFISVVDLDIIGNRIVNCLGRELERLPDDVRDFAGYGGLSLADVENLRVHDNIIEDNGPSHLHPVCGIFLLHGEGVDIERNRIVNNGAKTGEDPDDETAGWRGGIVIRFAMPGLVAVEMQKTLRPRQNGVPAALIHDNIVSQPLGRALSIRALGPVSVQGNNLTARGVIPSLSAPGFLATTVYILNLGLSNEIYLQARRFAGPTADPDGVEDIPFADAEFINLPATGIDDARLGQYLANGNVMFTNNQVLADLSEREVSFALSSVTILSLDDVVITDNQFNCNFLVDLFLSNLVAMGMSLRIADNRFSESLVFALFSSVGLGLFFNHTVNNQATHCILSVESPLAGFPFYQPEIQETGNMILVDWISKICSRFERLKRPFSAGQTLNTNVPGASSGGRTINTNVSPGSAGGGTRSSGGSSTDNPSLDLLP